MAGPTYTLISSNTITTTTASITFSSIPQGYTDLVMKMSFRTTDTGTASAAWTVVFNSSTSGYSINWIRGNGATVAAQTFASAVAISGGWENGSGSTTSTFSSSEMYIPNYTVSQNKPVYISNVTENDGTTAYIIGNAGLWLNTAAINSIKISPSAGSWNVGSSFFLYGIINS